MGPVVEMKVLGFLCCHGVQVMVGVQRKGWSILLGRQGQGSLHIERDTLEL